MQNELLTDRCRRLEFYETPEWAARAVLEQEILTHTVVDPCVGTGVLAKAAIKKGHSVIPIDIHDWGYEGTIVEDFLQNRGIASTSFSVLMNPPFSKAVQFVEKSFDLGARKVVAFQRFAWWESRGRRGFWERHPPNRIYICGDRANCWRHDIPENERGSSSPTAHAFFVWEKGHPPGTLLGHIWRDPA